MHALFHPLYLEVAVLLLGLTLLLGEAFAERLDKKLIAYAGAAGLGLILLLSFFAGGGTETPGAAGGQGTGFTAFYTTDGLAMFFKRFALVTTMGVLAMSVDYLDVIRRFTPGATAQGGLGEFLALPVLTCAGLMWMASAVDFVMIFVSLELVTISFYVLVTYTRRREASLEAGVKYLILGALSTGFLVYGVTWIFGVTGETNLDRVAAALAGMDLDVRTGRGAPVLFAFTLVLIALGFKVAAVPFQIWVPDVYQGAPTPVTAFLSIGSKAAGFVVLLRVLEPFFAQPALATKVTLVVAVIAAATLIYGNFAALPQNNLKRLLAYSSIAHAGYLLTAIASLRGDAGTGDAATIAPSDAMAFYLAGYLFMTLLAFHVMIVVAKHTGGSDDIAAFAGLGRRSPFLAFTMLVAMLSLAGLPLTAGGFGKFFVFTVALAQRQTALNVLAAIGIVTVACGFYYYLKVIRAMYFQPAPEGYADRVDAPALTDFSVAACASLLIILGVFPQPALRLLSHDAATPDRSAATAVTAPTQATAAHATGR